MQPSVKIPRRRKKLSSSSSSSSSPPLSTGTSPLTSLLIRNNNHRRFSLRKNPFWHTQTTTTTTTNNSNNFIFVVLITTTVLASIVLVSVIIVFGVFLSWPAQQQEQHNYNIIGNAILNSNIVQNIEHHSPKEKRMNYDRQDDPKGARQSSLTYKSSSIIMRKNSSFSLNSTKSVTPLDDYQSRRHFSYPIKNTRNHSDQLIDDDDDLPILVVGGSDGSGTRAYADVLARLGVPMIVDDVGTLDIHAKCLLDGDGWPALVRIVLQTIRGNLANNYTWDDFSPTQRAILQSSMENCLLQQYGPRGKQLRNKARQKGFPVAQKVLYGFKAPVSMLALPLLQRLYGRIKFLHVVRDGRDVALSKNKSPVQKFYYLYYGHVNATQKQEEFRNSPGDVIFREAMAMQLWNDWNAQVLTWEKTHNDGNTLDYLVVRTEDLMHPQTRLNSLAQLADFVGSRRPAEYLCCLSQLENIVDMGQSGQILTSVLAQDGRPPELLNDPMLSSSSSSTSSWLEQILDSIFSWIPQQFRTDTSGSTTHLRTRQRKKSNNNVPSTWQERISLFFGQKVKNNKGNLVGSAVRIWNENPLNSEHRHLLLDWNEDEQDGDESKSAASVVHIPWGNKDAKSQQNTTTTVDPLEYDTLLERMLLPPEFLAKQDQPQGGGTMRQSPNQQEQPPPPQRQSPKQVIQRYGKWRSQVVGRLELNRVLHREGSLSLSLFGYEPAVPFLDFAYQGDLNEQDECICTETSE